MSKPTVTDGALGRVEVRGRGGMFPAPHLVGVCGACGTTGMRHYDTQGGISWCADNLRDHFRDRHASDKGDR